MPTGWSAPARPVFLRCAVPKPKEQDRRAYDAWLADQVAAYQPDWVVLAGWMRMLSALHFLNHFPNRVINLHPALPGTFPGTHAIERAYEAFPARRNRPHRRDGAPGAG